METITDLIKGVSVPRMVKIREVFDDTHIPGEYDCGYGKCRIVPRSPGWSSETWNAHRNYMWQPRG